MSFEEQDLTNALLDNRSPLVQRFSRLHQLNDNEINALNKMHEQTTVLDANEIILHEGDYHKNCMVIVSGWAYRFSRLLDGDRQVINYYLPGDIISPFALVQPKTDYSIASLTKIDVCVFKPDFLLQMFSEEPRLGLIYGQMLGREDALSAEQIVRLGVRSAYERTAHLLLEFFHRLKLVGLTDAETTYSFPLTQELLADTLGMSFVHMNRTLRKLRDNNLIYIDSNQMTLLNVDELITIAEYKPYYPQIGLNTDINKIIKSTDFH
tara:strand:+ start:854 stop:1651 length:798 start_codon:yes stop_codon:yes gene_type:complete